MCIKCKIARITLAIVAALIIVILAFFRIPMRPLSCRCNKCGHTYNCDGHHYCPKWS